MSCTRVRMRTAVRTCTAICCKRTNFGLLLELELSGTADGPHCVEYSTWMRWPTTPALSTSHTRMELPTSMRCTQWRSRCSAHHSTYLREIRLQRLGAHLPRGRYGCISQLARPKHNLGSWRATLQRRKRSHRMGRFVQWSLCSCDHTECRGILSCCL